MDANTPRPKRQDGVVTSLNIAIEAMNLAKEASSMTPATVAFSSVSLLLTTIRVRLLLFSNSICLRLTYHQDSMVNKTDYVELGLACANVCKVLDRGMRGKKLDDLSQSVCEGIEDLTK